MCFQGLLCINGSDSSDDMILIWIIENKCEECLKNVYNIITRKILPLLIGQLFVLNANDKSTKMYV